MKITETQPLEDATPVVPETTATVEGEAGREQPPKEPTAGRPGGAPEESESVDPSEEPSARHYPAAPAGSAGHP